MLSLEPMRAKANMTLVLLTLSSLGKVRASVRNFDLDMPTSTIRAWTIGLLLCTVGSAVNMLLSLRNPAISLTTFVIQLIAYPLGLLWDLVFPDRVFNVRGVKFNLKPGPFNFKEHVVIVVMSNVGVDSLSADNAPGRVADYCASFPRLRTAAALCTRPTLSLPSACGTTRTSVGHGRCCLASRRSARAMAWPAWRGGSSSGPPP